MIRKIVIIFCLLLAKNLAWSQTKLPVYPDSIFSTYYHQRVALFNSLPQTSGDIIFIGNSITDGGEWSELFDDKRIKNRGISGDISAGVINRIDEVAKRKPAKVFLMIGINDLARGIAPDSVVKNILLTSAYLREKAPASKLFLQSILPVNEVYGKFGGHTSKGTQIKQVNEQLKVSATNNGYTYIDLFTAFSDYNGKLRSSLSNDGLHLTGEGYLLWKHLVYPYLYDVPEKASLIPLPQQLKWKEGRFPLYDCKTIVVKDATLQEEAERLKGYLLEKGLYMNIANSVPANPPAIELALDKKLGEEAYRLQASANKITLHAGSGRGAFYGLQTLLQLARTGVYIDACDINDAPAFAWRGYMIDVGRNYQSMELLKQQIDIMAKYKFNIFHFHPTEDIAWRIAIKQYPQLTEPEHMLRDKGEFYTEADIKELIAYCKERYITFIPEIDMPGHSAAFRRAMKTDMQSDTGLAIVKNILTEICTTYDVPYIHIGADEVKITNKEFVPEVTAHIQKLGKKVIGWEPGGNFSDNTIRQMWMDDNARISSSATIQYIDSRHLYLNHMDPLEAVVTIFNRRISNKENGDDNAIGATLCMWHDRAVAEEEDVQRMNPVYPGMLSFAERVWRGGGYSGWTAIIGEPGSQPAKEFSEFENRLLDHHQQNFENLPFPYVRQSSLQWNLYGPFENRGDLSKQFDPENKSIGSLKPTTVATGGTIIWRHWWAPLIKGVLETPKENSTWYASTLIWSDEEKTGNFWIGFNNLSRSPATDSPKPGTWDNHQSKVWVNGKSIEPPRWKRGGQKGHSEIPLVDEGYEFREPTRITLKKGWNEVLIKSPIGSFKGKDWQNPEKWMFTFVPVP